jgi:ABC-type sugar transport system permease subunit
MGFPPQPGRNDMAVLDLKKTNTAAGLEKRTLPPRWREKLTPYLFISPFFIGFLVLQFLPILFSILLSFAEWNGMSAIQFNGLDNFRTLIADTRFWDALRVTLVITLVCTFAGTAGALLLSVLLEQLPDTLASILRVVFFMPSVTSVVVIAFVWRQLYNADTGLLNTILNTVGLPGHEWLKDPQTALPALIVMLIWAGLGWDSLIVTAGLRSIPSDFYDAARVDGATGWTEFWYITLPLLRPTLLFVTVTGIIFLWGIFAQPQLLTEGGPLRKTQTIAMYLYDNGFQYHKFGYASAIAVALSVLMFISSYLNFKFVRSDVDY